MRGYDFFLFDSRPFQKEVYFQIFISDLMSVLLRFLSLTLLVGFVFIQFVQKFVKISIAQKNSPQLRFLYCHLGSSKQITQIIFCLNDLRQCFLLNSSLHQGHQPILTQVTFIKAHQDQQIHIFSYQAYQKSPQVFFFNFDQSLQDILFLFEIAISSIRSEVGRKIQPFVIFSQKRSFYLNRHSFHIIVEANQLDHNLQFQIEQRVMKSELSFFILPFNSYYNIQYYRKGSIFQILTCQHHKNLNKLSSHLVLE